jgi:cytoskeletal protein RodZ
VSSRTARATQRNPVSKKKKKKKKEKKRKEKKRKKEKEKKRNGFSWETEVHFTRFLGMLTFSSNPCLPGQSSS